ncbi:GRP family sugar transporter [Isobaculum melis]|uniref:Glucose uptake protein n=1 Tax=Isobaculum melis TaxID=142588 RepID=A0A1H9SQ23_9LACT|nr:GRP family sugar transporter [Isobaculum melis]SER87066.1 glucose uptake protein [Isobaculum melis]
MTLLIAIIPAIAWGSIGLVSGKMGGNAYNQTLGMTIGAFLFSLGVFFVYQPTMDWFIIGVGLLSGMFWALGQNQQFQSMSFIGVSTALPISTGFQLMGNTLAGVILFKEWVTTRDTILGTTALIILILGVVLTSLRDKKAAPAVGSGETKNEFSKGFRAIAISTVGYVLYSVTINASGVNPIAVILPQAGGMLLGGMLMSFNQDVYNKYTLRNIVSGILWGIGNIFMLISMKSVGLAVAFSLSQTGIIISTLGGILFLGEKKTKKQFISIVIGCLLIIVGGVLIGYIKSGS